MKKILNDPTEFVDEFVAGILLAHPDQLRAVTDDLRVLADPLSPRNGKVGIVTGGGSGHLPLFKGYVGEGLCSAVAVGNVFSSPSVDQCLEATKAADGGAGVLYIYGNYGGDVLNFDMAADLADLEGIDVRTVLGRDDVASQPRERAEDRRGVAGIFFVYKIAGAAAARGDQLDEVTRIAQKAADSTATMGVGLTPTILPTTSRASFALAEDEMEVGIGIHGEPGFHRGPLATAAEIAQMIVPKLIDDLALTGGDDIAVLVNGMGATPLEELYVLYRDVRTITDAAGIAVRKSYVGEYATSLEMAGASISFLRLDQELQELLEAPAHSPFFREA